MKLEFNMEQLAILDRAIQQLPFHTASPLLQNINDQLQKQLQQNKVDTQVNINPNIPFDQLTDEQKKLVNIKEYVDVHK